MNQSWQPILDGTSRKRALKIVEGISDALKECKPKDPSLSSGSAGLAIVFGYLDRRRMQKKYLDDAIDALQTVRMDPSLYSGFTGIGWAYEHLQKRAGERTTASEIDTVLAKYLQLKPWRSDYDLINGLAGLGVYALERLPNPKAHLCAELVVDRFAEISTEDKSGIAWFTSSELLPAWQRERCPDGYYNLGLAHGIPGVIAVLSLMHGAGIKPRKSKRLLEGAVRWMLHHRLPSSASCTFPSWAAKNLEQEESRSAWCYGDPGAAMALFIAGRALRNKQWEALALAIARRTTERSEENSRVIDTGICHGAAGLAHLYNRLFQTTGEKVFLDSARLRFEQTLGMHRPGKGIGGYLTYLGPNDGWQPSPGMIDGAAGIALALLSACTDDEPRWDRMFLLS